MAVVQFRGFLYDRSGKIYLKRMFILFPGVCLLSVFNGLADILTKLLSRNQKSQVS